MKKLAMTVTVATLICGACLHAGTVTFETKRHENTRWSVKWQARGLKKGTGLNSRHVTDRGPRGLHSAAVLKT